jgi:predicted GIY-YIG superfamily endonuclease
MPFDQRLPRPFTSRTINEYAPAAAGVYGISNSHEWLYIGQTENINGALQAHLQDSSAALMKFAPTGFVFEVCAGGNRPARQESLIREYGPTCNGHSAGR